MTKLPKSLIRVVVIGVVAVVVIGVAWYVFTGGATKTVTAQFDSAVGVYPGTPVKILGVPVGDVTKVSPTGNYVKIDMEYDSKYSLPSNAISVVVANSLVSDRYIQLAPAYGGSGPTLASGATIPRSRTASPAELDDIYAALNKLSVALGPNGANKTGALSTFVSVSEANLDGNGTALGSTITKLSEAVTTLSNGRQDLFGTVRNLQVFNKALADSDAQVKHFEEQLAQVAGDLASERGDLGAALHNLSGALNVVAAFVKTNAGKLHTDIGGFKVITNILIKEQASLNETLAVAPIALSNLVHLYQPDLGVLPSRSNLASLTDPVNLCQVLQVGGLLDPVTKVLGPQTGKIATACAAVLKKLPSGSKLTLPAGLDPGTVKSVLGQLLGGSGGIITGGG
jgi:phospholipid/cholesterol/gamma-HCH transport system substrate-binding protein